MNCFSQHTDCQVSANHDVTEEMQGRRFKRMDNNDLNLLDEDVLREASLSRLGSDRELVQLLASPSIQRLLKRLDAARDRRYSFSRLYETNSRFVDVVNRIHAILETSG